MRRASLALAVAAILVALFPAAVHAERVTRFTDHRVEAGCEGEFDGGFASLFIRSSDEFGEVAVADVWLGAAIPFEDPPTLSGSGDAVDVTSNGEIILSGALAFVDSAGEDAGDGMLVATMTRAGDPFVEGGDSFGNRTSHTVRVLQFLDGEATLTLPDATEVSIGCGGEIADESVFETNPHAFTANNAGTIINCFWEFEGGFAFFFAVDDAFGFFADSGLVDGGLEIFPSGQPSGSIDETGVTALVPLADTFTGDPYTADAAAVFTPVGDLVTSFITSQTAKTKLVEQRLSVDGLLEFSTGDDFTMDDEACFANTFVAHDIGTGPSGPKPGPAADNDTPDGAIALSPGDRVQVNTTGTAVEAEVPITTCPQGEFDDLGHTVWYTIEGTGDEITVDTAGTLFDTVMAVYVMDGDAFVEIACIDDVFFDPIGITFQAAISGPTEIGVTYWVQVGGFRDPFFGDAQSGRLKLSVE